MKLKEDEMLDRIRCGNQEGFLELVDLYKKRIISLCHSYTHDYQEAEDLSQEVFITLYKNLPSFRGECSISTYLYRIAVSRCLDYKRRKSIRGFLTGLFQNEVFQDQDLDEKNHIRSCIFSLPEELKVPVILYYYMGLSQREIGDILKLPQKTIEGRICRAKKRLKKDIEKGDEFICSRNGIG